MTPASTTAGQTFDAPLPILPAHDTSGFLSRHDALDNWLKDVAIKAESKSARTYVVCAGGTDTVVGYYSVSTGAVARHELPRKLRNYVPATVPVMVIGRLAVARRFERRGIGSGMLRDAMLRIAQASQSIGCRAIVVHAIDDEASEFYVRYGFAAFPAGSRTLFLPVPTLQATR